MKSCHKPIDFSIDFSYRLKTDVMSYGHWLETSKSVNRNLVPSPNTKNNLLSLSEVAEAAVLERSRKSTFWPFRICILLNVQDCI